MRKNMPQSFNLRGAQSLNAMAPFLTHSCKLA
jgi:hypothetical protein